MKTNYELRHATNPQDAKAYDTARLRKEFLIDRLFAADEVNLVYSMYDRMIVGGAMPVDEELQLEALFHPPQGDGHLQCGRRRRPRQGGR